MRSSLNDLLTRSSELSTEAKDSDAMTSSHRVMLDKKANAQGLRCPICDGNTVVKYIKSLKYRTHRCLERDCSYSVAQRGELK